MTTENLHDTDYLILNRLLRKETPLPGQAQVGYAMAETTDNQSASLVQASNLLKQGVIKKIAIADPLPPYDYGYPGPDYCIRILLGLGVQKDQVMTISPSTHVPSMNTQTELIMVTEYLKKTGYNGNITIIAPWFHLLRSYITALSEFKNAYLKTKVFVSSVPLGPYETVTHSQGIRQGSRRGIFYEEIGKCQTYNNLMSAGEALEIYKKHRNKASN